MDPASAAPSAGSAGIPAAPRTPAFSPPSAGRSQTDAPPPAGSSPPHTPRAAPARTVPRLSSLRPLPILPEDLLLPDFCSGATGLSGRFSEGFSLRRSQQTLSAYRKEAMKAGGAMMPPYGPAFAAAASRYKGLSSPTEAQKLAIRSAVAKKNSSASKVRLMNFDLSSSILTPT